MESPNRLIQMANTQMATLDISLSNVINATIISLYIEAINRHSFQSGLLIEKRVCHLDSYESQPQRLRSLVCFLTKRDIHHTRSVLEGFGLLCMKQHILACTHPQKIIACCMLRLEIMCMN